LFEAYSGLVYMTGEKNGPPMHVGYPIADPIGGIFGAFGVLAALVERLKNPDAPGQEIDLSLTEATMRLLEVLPIEYDQLGIVHERIGNNNAYVAPANVFRTKDEQWVTFTAAVQSVFERFCAVIGRKDLVSDPKFASNAERMRNSDEINAIVADWIAANPLDTVMNTLAEAGVSVAPVLSNAQAAVDPHFVARKAVTKVRDDDFGEVAVPCVVPRLSRTPGEVRTAGPAMGTHNAEVYGEWLGLTEAEILRLREAEVI